MPLVAKDLQDHQNKLLRIIFSRILPTFYEFFVFTYYCKDVL